MLRYFWKKNCKNLEALEVPHQITHSLLLTRIDSETKLSKRTILS